MKKQKQIVRKAWLAHGEADNQEQLLTPVKHTCTTMPLSAPGSRPVSQGSQVRARAKSQPAADSIARSFWAPELPALGGSVSGRALQVLAAEAQELALAALAARDAVKLDELAKVLVKILGLVSEETHPILSAAIQQSGVQCPKTKSDVALLAAPTTHDLVTLLTALSAQVTYGVALPPATPSMDTVSEEAKDGFQDAAALRRQVAELRRTLEVRVDQLDGAAVSPRFSSMAHAIIRKEEQLQRDREIVRSQRALNQAGLDRVREHLGRVDGPTEVAAVLRRMEEEHVKAEQKWLYKRMCLHQERMRLMEISMSAFCKAVYVDRGLQYRSLIHDSGPGGDPQIRAPPPSRPQTGTLS
jgi:hypothetical protein